MPSVCPCLRLLHPRSLASALVAVGTAATMVLALSIQAWPLPLIRLRMPLLFAEPSLQLHWPPYLSLHLLCAFVHECLSVLLLFSILYISHFPLPVNKYSYSFVSM